MKHRQTEKIIGFWDKFFENYKPIKIDKSDLRVNTKLDRLLKTIGENSESILEVGVGTGYGLLTAALIDNKPKHIIGFDPSKTAVNIFKRTLELSGINGFNIVNEDHNYLSSLPDESFDSIIALNVLDVVEEEVSNFIINQAKRILKPEGYFLLKLNFYLTPELIRKIDFVELSENVYTLNGVIRSINYTVNEWVRKFIGFEVVEEIEIERSPKGLKDRCLLLQKSKY